MDDLLISSATTLATNVISKLVETYIYPKINDIIKDYKISKELSDFQDGVKFEEYLKNSYERLSYLKTIVFKNQKKSIFDLYVPLKVIKQGDINNVPILIDEYNDNFIPTYKKVLITDTAGMGKSTILTWLFLSCIKNQKGIPVFIKLGNLSEDKPILNEIINEFNTIASEVNKDFILKLIERGDFVFFFDGYDEIPLSEKLDVTLNVHKFISEANNNFFVMSSRPDTSTNSFNDFLEFNIQPMVEDEAFKLIEKYGYYSDFSYDLINKIEEDKIENKNKLSEFLKNPMLVSLLFLTYKQSKNSISDIMPIFFRKVYDALFEEHDTEKGELRPREKFSKLNSDEFFRVLRRLAFKTFLTGESSFTTDKLLRLIKEAKKDIPKPEFSESDFLRDIRKTVPLFLRDGDIYRWSYEPIHEYFVARYIYEDAENKKEDILYKMYKSKKNYRYLNVLDLFYDIDYKTFRNVIIYDIVKEFIGHCDGTYRQFTNTSISTNDIFERKQITFRNFFALIVNYSQDQNINLRRYVIDTYGEEFDAYEELNEIPKIQGTLIPSIKIISDKSYLMNILELLHSKKEPFIKTKSAKNNIINLDLNFIDEKLVVIDDNKESVLNSENNFHIITSLLINSSNNLVLDYDDCQLIKKSIEKSLNSSDEYDF